LINTGRPDEPSPPTSDPDGDIRADEAKVAALLIQAQQQLQEEGLHGARNNKEYED
jgi:hypothetical protein